MDVGPALHQGSVPYCELLVTSSNFFVEAFLSSARVCSIEARCTLKPASIPDTMLLSSPSKASA